MIHDGTKALRYRQSCSIAFPPPEDIGITGPHIGVSWRIAVLELAPGEGRTYVNPQIIWRSDELATHEEGSVSTPGAIETVMRPARVRVAYQDIHDVLTTEGRLGCSPSAFSTRSTSQIHPDINIDKAHHGGAYVASPSEINWDAFSPIIMHGKFVFEFGRLGMMELSATRSP